jgi:2-keto-4-pentenoate hydratase/2-oxohepta-3-ene-1,7-dioic acid hydratase in catechol pathway
MAMKLAMIESGLGPRPAALLKDGMFLDLRAAFGASDAGDGPSSVTDILASMAEDRSVSDLVAQVEQESSGLRKKLASALVDPSAARLLPPVAPRFILCTGGAYQDHIREMGAEPPKAPGSFIKSVHALTGPRDPIILPPAAPAMVDYECELACVFARPCYNLDPEDALACVGGYTMVNDVSARDDVADYFAAVADREVKRAGEAWDRVVYGKQFPSFCPIGPVVTTVDEIPDPHDVTVRTLLNGQVMQSAHTSDLVFRIADTISRFSRWYAFAPGDVMTTGSPAGVGVARDPQIFLRPGDVVEVQGGGIGSLINVVEAAP